MHLMLFYCLGTLAVSAQGDNPNAFFYACRFHSSFYVQADARVTQIFNSPGMITSVSGVWTVNRTYSIGAKYQRLTSPINIRRLIGVSSPTIVHPDYMNAGLSFKYRLFSNKLIHLEPELGFNWALIRYAYPDANMRRWNAFMLEPGINMDYQPSSYFSFGAGISYRVHARVALDGIRNKDLNGISGLVYIRVGNLGRLAAHYKRKIQNQEKSTTEKEQKETQPSNTEQKIDIEKTSQVPKVKKKKKSSEYEGW